MASQTVQVAASNDDAYDYEDGSVQNRTANYLYMGEVSGLSVCDGFRFTGFNIPAGATILQAYLEVYFYADIYEFKVNIYAEDNASPSSFYIGWMPRQRPKTSAYTTWNTTLSSGWNQTPDFASVIQELVDTYGALDTIVILMEGANDKWSTRVYSYDGNPSYAAKLTVVWQTQASLADTVALSDSVVGGLRLSRSLADSLSLSDLPEAWGLLPVVPGDFRFSVCDANGNVLGQPVLTAVQVRLLEALDEAGQIQAAFPATDRRAWELQENRYMKVYHAVDGYLGEFIIERVETDASGAVLVVTGTSLLRELAFYNCYLWRTYDNVPITDVVSTNHISGNLYGLLHGTGWTAGTVENLGNVTATFAGESILEALRKLAEALGAHIRHSDRTLDFGTFGDLATGRLQSVEAVGPDMADTEELGIISRLAIVEESSDVVNRIIVLGGGDGVAQLTLEHATYDDVKTGTNPDGSTFWYLEDPVSVLRYGARWGVFVQDDIRPASNSAADLEIAANMLYQAARAWLERHSSKYVAYRLEAVKLPAGLQVGDRVRVRYRGVATFADGRRHKFVDVDDDLWVLAIQRDYSGDAPTYLVDVATHDRQEVSDVELLTRLVSGFKVRRVHTQPSIAIDTWEVQGELDDSHEVEIPLDIDERILRVHSCVLRLKTRPLRSLHRTTAAGSAHTHDIPAHQHNVSVISGVPAENPVYWWPGGPDIGVAGSGGIFETGSVDTLVTEAESSHNHGMQFGIQDDTVYPASVGIKIDGVDRTAELGGPWGTADAALNVTLDVTEYVDDQAEHLITLYCASSRGVVSCIVKLVVSTQAIRV